MEYLHSAACDALKARRNRRGFVAIPNYETLCISLDQDNKGVLERNSVISSDQLDERLRSKGLFEHNFASSKSHRGLQLLVCKHLGGSRIREQAQLGYPIPFADIGTYERVQQVLQLPLNYAHHFMERHTVPLWISKSGNISQFIVQTPAYGDLFISAAFAFDHTTGNTTGLIIMSLHTTFYHNFESCLVGLIPFASHPLMCAAVLYHVLDRQGSDILYDIDGEMEAITAGMNNLPPELMRKPKPGKEYNNVQEIHIKLVAQHKRLTRSIFEVIDKISEACETALSTDATFFDPSTPGGADMNFLTSREQLHRYVETIAFGTRFRTQERRRLLQRIDVQLQELYNMMTTEIAKNAAADNRLMINMSEETVKISRLSHAIAEHGKSYSKSLGFISIITMMFLPATAFASVFSMSPFFSVSETTSKLQVSRQIWIYFAWIVPVTFSVVCLYLAHANRDAIRAGLSVRARRSPDNPVEGDQSARKESQVVV